MKEWIFNGIGTQIISILTSLLFGGAFGGAIGWKIGYKKGQQSINQQQISRNSYKQTQIGEINKYGK